MDVTASALSFVGPKMKLMAQLPPDMGIEIFWEWGSEDYWKRMLPVLLYGRTGNFSIHAPMAGEDISRPEENTAEQFDRLCRPFEVYHRFNSRFYVIHTNGSLPINISELDLEDRRKRSVDRIWEFHRICQTEDIKLVVENVGRNAQGTCLFGQSDFLSLFRQIPDLYCLLDTGHALLSDIDIPTVQRELRGQIAAYHLHDNNGVADQHLRIGAGVFDWKKWAEAYRLYTPASEVVLEYDGISEASVYQDDQFWLRKELSL